MTQTDADPLVRVVVGDPSPEPGSGASVLRVAGPNATAHLQALTTQDVEAVAVGEATTLALLTPKARIVAVARAIHRDADAWLLLAEPAAVERLEAVLVRMRFRRAVDIGAPAASDLGRLVVAGRDAAAALGVGSLTPDAVIDLDAATPDADAATPDADGAVAVAVADGAYDVPWFDVVGPPAALGALRDRLVAAGAEGETGVAETLLAIIAVRSGVGRFGRELTEERMPAEAGIVERTVSFTKGCYLGQEPVSRLHHRGHPNRLLRGLRFAEPGAPPADPGPLAGDGARDPAFAIQTADGAEVGYVTSVAGRDGLGYVRVAVEPGGEVIAAGVRATVVALGPVAAGTAA